MAYTTIKKPSDYFNTLLHTGDGTDGRGITGVGFQPDLTWFKARSTGYESQVYDIIRGATKKITTTDSGAESTQANGLQSFDSDGFTVGNANATNVNSVTYVSWNWLGANGTASNTDGSITSTVSVNTTSGVSIVSYTGTGASATVGHGLGVAPKMIIVKDRDDAASWQVYHASLGATKYLKLDATDTEATNTNRWNDTEPTSSVFTVGTASGTNGYVGSNYIAYCFAEKQGFSKFGSYVGNGNSSNGTFVYLGFKPAFIMFKMIDVNDWYVFDNKRDGNYNPEGNKYLLPNSTAAEGSATSKKMDFLSNGFKLYTADGSQNQNGTTYIYMAFAEEPLVGDNPCTAK